jgi:flagellar hook-associated protein 1
MSLFAILDHSARALQTAGAGVSVASNNVANADSAGYARESLSQGPAGTLRARGLLLGQGVAAHQVLSSYDGFSQASVFGRLGDHAFDQGRAAAFQSIETSFLQGGDGGLSNAIDGLFQAFSQLEANPESSAPRLAVIAAGDVLAQMMSRAAGELGDRQVRLEGQVTAQLGTVNSAAEQIAALNVRIVELEAGGAGAHDLRAQRTALTEELSRLGPVSVNEAADGSMRVFFADHALVEAGTARSLSAETDPATGLSAVHISMGGASLDITGSIDRGSLGASLDARDTIVPGLLAELDELAFGLATEVNAVHAAGFGLDGATGRDFFAAPAAVAGAALALSLDAAVADDPDAIAASSTATGVPGDNNGATALAALSNSLTMSTGTQTFNQYWGTVLSGLGHDASSAYAAEARTSVELNAALDVRDSISGVSLEEEALDLLRFQDAYKAAAKVMQTANEMLEELLNLV